MMSLGWWDTHEERQRVRKRGVGWVRRAERQRTKKDRKSSKGERY